IAYCGCPDGISSAWSTRVLSAGGWSTCATGVAHAASRTDSAANARPRIAIPVIASVLPGFRRHERDGHADSRRDGLAIVHRRRVEPPLRRGGERNAVEDPLRLRMLDARGGDMPVGGDVEDQSDLATDADF